MIHLNGNLLCTIDTETTGLDPDQHEIFEICILPLDYKLEVSRDIIPFNIKIRPEKEDNIEWGAMQATQQDFMQLCQTGLDKWVAADLFERWFEKLGLAERKRIMPLAHNWIFDKVFIQKWLGNAAFDLHFDGRYRDTMSLALSINDEYDAKNERVPFPKLNLSYIATQLKLDFDKVHNALDDCILTTQVYKELVYRRF